jgi:hypothetical protein
MNIFKILFYIAKAIFSAFLKLYFSCKNKQKATDIEIQYSCFTFKVKKNSLENK